MFVDTDTVFQLAVYFPVDIFQQFGSRLYRLFIALGDTRCHCFMIGYTYFVKLLQVGRVDGYEVDALIQWKSVVISFQQYAIIE